MSKISNERMVNTWSKRVAQLKSLRPITQEEALRNAADFDAAADAIEAKLAEYKEMEQEVGRIDGYLCPVGTANSAAFVAAEARRKTKAIAQLRAEGFGDQTRILQYRMMAKDFRAIAAEPVGQRLAASIAEAEARLAHYSSL